MAAIKSDPVKRLWGLAAGRCSHCRKKLLEDEVHIGEMAHIIAEKEDGPRGEEEFTGDRNGYDNLILLCPTHHRMVDKNPRKYKTQLLHQWKSEHEYWVETRLNTTKERDQDIDSLTLIFRAIPFTEYLSFLQYAPQQVDIRFSGLKDVMESFVINRPHGYPFDDPELTELFDNFDRGHRNVTRWILGHYNGTYIYSNAANYPGNVNIATFEAREFNFEERSYLNKKIDNAITNFEKSYKTFIKFLRDHYPEVILDDYRPWRFD